MSKLSTASTFSVPKVFAESKDFKLIVQHKDNKIIGFEVTKKKETKTFPVVKYNILKAWKQVEEFCKDVK